jgi:hypothetical protein
MMTRIGGYVVACLEQAGERHLKEPLPHIYQQFLLQIGGTDLLQDYDWTPAYWHRVQAILDCFFTHRQRAEICGWLLTDGLLRAQPEFAWFHQQALAERRLRAMINETLSGIKKTHRVQPAGR